MDRLRSRGIFSGKGLKRQQVRNGLWSEQSSRRTCGWGSCILAQHPSAGHDFVPQANSARKMRARSQGSPSFAQEKGQIIDGISLRCLPQNSVCRRTQGVKEGRGERWGGEKTVPSSAGDIGAFSLPKSLREKKTVQVLAQLDLLSRGASSNIPRSTPPRRPLLRSLRTTSDQSEGSQSLGSVAPWGLVVVVSNALSQVTATPIR